ncbi:hypothetical protein XBJ2_870016 [Xenorhabdus bovienii str. Jollieti]|uniref:Uncharacterized protein n=1 Tax=Xenorhabdus bovienii (strain SS-2004) TaxID=406818 RepID=D3V0S6_XENBS|nr:hypothetical protein XBJ1_1599 [Xenorhabdus bovienii SS-2004]CDH30437.1 hypothetical protein XBJ2_870016 [Xenorhabdus bovienii str. Jollieti]
MKIINLSHQDMLLFYSSVYITLSLLEQALIQHQNRVMHLGARIYFPIKITELCH